MMITLLLEGVAGAVVLIIIAFLLSRFTRDVIGRAVLVIGLFVAAVAYLGFAIVAVAGLIWILVELVQVVIFGAVAWRGLRGSPYWIAVGWALHPLWDIGLHYLGPGQSFAPLAYVIACGSFDVMVAGYVAVAYGLIGGPRLKIRDVVL